MAVISISITESTDQIISGIPKIISLSTNIPSTIFYTLDGTEPDTYSSIYTEAINLPTDELTVNLKIYATNGSDSSAIISKSYSTTISSNSRMPHASVLGVSSSFGSNLFPFGSGASSSSIVFQTNANAGLTIDNPDVANTNLGFDGAGNPIGGTDSATPMLSYEFIFSETDSIGQRGIGIGTLPSTVTVIGKNYPEEYTQQSSNRSDKLFNPRALVIFQDSRTERADDPVHLNRQFFSLENSEIVRDGGVLLNPGVDTATITGSFLRSHYNPRTNEITYYYYDSAVNRWIISKTLFQPKIEGVGNLSNMVFSRDKSERGGNGFVFHWMPFRGRVLI